MIDLVKHKYKELSLIVLISLFAFCVNYIVGSNGVYPVDTFIHYDYGYRILLGDDPIKDYWIVHGLLIDYLQSFFFLIFGNNWTAYLIHSSLMNVSIVIFSIYIFLTLKIKFEYVFFIAISISLLAYPVSGSPFLDLHSSYFSLFAFYFIILSILKKQDYLWFFVSFFLCLAFFSKQVPAAYYIISFSFINFIFCTMKKDLKIIYFYALGAFSFTFLLIIFLYLRGINLSDLILQIFLFPQTIGLDRYINYDLNFNNLILDYKFIYIILFCIVTVNFIFFKKVKNYFSSDEFKILITIIILIFASIFHQIYTKNQIYIFFLIPILIGFSIYYVNSFEIKTNKFLIYSLLLFCLFTTTKYTERYDIDRKFHELEKINKKDAIKINSLSEKLKGLNWITPYFKNPEEELELIKTLFILLEKDQSNKMLITEYNFFSSILEENLNSPSRTFDNISFPKKNTIYYRSYKKFLIHKIESKKIKSLYIFEPKEIKQKRLNHLIFNYIPENCFKIKKINPFIKKLIVTKCDELKS